MDSFFRKDVRKHVNNFAEGQGVVSETEKYLGAVPAGGDRSEKGQCLKQLCLLR